MIISAGPEGPSEQLKEQQPCRQADTPQPHIKAMTKEKQQWEALWVPGFADPIPLLFV